MRLLLDTHALLWALADPGRLSDVALATIQDRRNDVWVSAASAWEVATKFRLGKLPDAQALILGYAEHLETLGAAELPVSSRHALDAGSLQWTHRDPFDRILAAQAIVESAALVTVDPVFADLPGLRRLWH